MVHIAAQGASDYGIGQVNRETGLLQDAALYADIRSEYPQDDLEDFDVSVFLRAFLFNEEDPEAIMNWSHDLLFPDVATHIWINGKLCGGLFFPQSEDPDDFPPFKETLSDFVIYRS